MDINEIRLTNLTTLLNEQFGGVRASLAKKLQVAPNNISRYYSSNSKDRRNISDETARSIEVACEKPRGWMDTPPQNRRITELTAILNSVPDDMQEAALESMKQILEVYVRRAESQ